MSAEHTGRPFGEVRDGRRYPWSSLAATSRREARATQDGLEPGRVYWERGWEWIATERQHGIRP